MQLDLFEEVHVKTSPDHSAEDNARELYSALVDQSSAILTLAMRRAADGSDRVLITLIDKLFMPLRNMPASMLLSKEQLSNKELNKLGLSPEAVRAIRRDLLGIHEVKQNKDF